MVTFNSSVNLFIYCGFGKKFRREFKKLLGLKVDTELEVRFLTSHPDNKAKRGIYFQFVSPHAPLYHSHGPNPHISRFSFLKVIVEKPSEKSGLILTLIFPSTTASYCVALLCKHLSYFTRAPNKRLEKCLL